MNGQALCVDHVGIVGADLDTLSAAYRRLGFQVTPPAHHEGGRTGNHCVMLDGAYLELIATLPGGTSTTLARFLARYAGAHVLAFRIQDEQAALRRLAAAGFPDLVAHATQRARDSVDPASPMVGFTLVTPPDPPEGRIHLIRHRTPDVMWQPALMTHDNHVVRLAAVDLVVEQPEVTAAWFSRITGRPVTPDSNRGLALELATGAVRFLPPGAIPTNLSPPLIARLTLQTDDRNHALRTILSRHLVAHHIEADTVTLRQDDLMLRFEPIQDAS